MCRSAPGGAARGPLANARVRGAGERATGGSGRRRRDLDSETSTRKASNARLPSQPARAGRYALSLRICRHVLSCPFQQVANATPDAVCRSARTLQPRGSECAALRVTLPSTAGSQRVRSRRARRLGVGCAACVAADMARSHRVRAWPAAKGCEGSGETAATIRTPQAQTLNRDRRNYTDSTSPNPEQRPPQLYGLHKPKP